MTVPSDVQSDDRSDAPAVPVRPPGPPVRLAFIVFGMALLVFVGGIIAESLSSSGQSTTAATAPLRTAAGDPVPAIAAKALMKPMLLPGQPPADVVQALALPQGTTAVPKSLLDQTVSNYDQQMTFSSSLTQAALIAFFHNQLRSQGWSNFSQGPPAAAELAPSGSVEVLARHPGSDGYYWEVGVVVLPTQASGGSAAATTHFELRLFLVSDQ